MNLQKLILAGRATKDAELISTKAGKQFSTFDIAVNRYVKDKEPETNYYECLVFGEKSASVSSEKVKKGDLLFVIGRPEADSYIGKDGEAKSKLKIIAEEWQVIKTQSN